MMDKTRGARVTRSGAKRALHEEKENTRNAKNTNDTVPILRHSPKLLQVKNNESDKLNQKAKTSSNPPETKKPDVMNLKEKLVPVRLGAPIFSSPAVVNPRAESQKLPFVKREILENVSESNQWKEVESPKKYEDLRKMQIDEEFAWINGESAPFDNSEHNRRSNESRDSDEFDLSTKRPKTFHNQTVGSQDLNISVEDYQQESSPAHSEFGDLHSPHKTTDGSERLDLTTNGKWNPISFAKKCLFDMKNGVMLSRAECDEAAKLLTRNQRDIDYYPYLELAQKFHSKDSDLQNLCFGLAFSTMMQNKTNQKLKKATNTTGNMEIPVIEGNGFSLDQAMRNEEIIKLPSGFTFRMSSLLSTHQASKYTSTKFQESSKSLLRAAFKKLASHDFYFAAYSPTEYSTSGYFPLGEQFYKSVAKFIYSGFKQEFSHELESKCCCMAREVLTYLQDRFRKEYNLHSKVSVTQLTEDLRAHLKREGINLEYFDLDFKKEPVHQNFKSLKIGN